MFELNNRQSQARIARRKHMDESSATSLRVIHPESNKRKRSLWIPYPSEIFPTDYNQRLPEWRWRASHSAQQEHWKNWKEFQVAALGTTLGLSNVMYFPFHAAMYGQGTYVYAYILMQLLVGFPILFLQMALGQFTSKDTIRVFSLVPLAQGVGYSFAILTFIANIISAVEHSWILFYMLSAFNIHFSPFSWELPWTNCSWTERQIAHFVKCSNYDPTIFNKTPNTYCPDKYHHDTILNMKGDDCLHTDQYYFNWRLIGCLILVYLTVYAFVFKGIKSVGKVVLYAVPFACSCLVVFLFVVIVQSQSFSETAGAALEGIQDFLTPDWEKAASINVIRHVMMSLHLDKGTMIVIGSYARFQSSTHYHAFYVCLADVGLALLSGLVVNSHWGITKSKQGVDFKDIYDRPHQGIEFKFFMTIMKAIEDMNAFPPVWVFIFFSTLLILGVTNMVAASLLFFKSINEYFPQFKKRNYLVNMVVLLIMFIFSVPFVTLGFTPPLRLMGMFDCTPLKYIELVIVLLSISAFVYFYGLKRLRQDIDFMLQFYPNKFFAVMWVSLPVIFLIIVCAEISEPEPTHKHLPTLEIPSIVFAGVLLPTLIMAIWNIIRLYKRGELSKLLSPAPEIPHWEITKRYLEQSPQTVVPPDSRLLRQAGRSVLLVHSDTRMTDTHASAVAASSSASSSSDTSAIGRPMTTISPATSVRRQINSLSPAPFANERLI